MKSKNITLHFAAQRVHAHSETRLLRNFPEQPCFLTNANYLLIHFEIFFSQCVEAHHVIHRDWVEHSLTIFQSILLFKEICKHIIHGLRGYSHCRNREKSDAVTERFDIMLMGMLTPERVQEETT